MERCDWAKTDELMIEYHDTEWGVPIHDERLLFEFLTLEGAQAGLSWLTILRKRAYYRAAFDNFEPDKIALYTSYDIKRLLNQNGIIKNRLKIESVISNAQAFLAIQNQFGSFSNYIWSFTEGKSIHNNWKSHIEIPQYTVESSKMSKDMKNRGFKFVGPTICYSFMQAVGIVNDHTVHCFRHEQLYSTPISFVYPCSVI